MIDLTQIPKIGTWVVVQENILFRVERRSRSLDSDGNAIAVSLWDSPSGGSSFAAENCFAVSADKRRQLAEGGGSISISGVLTRFEPVSMKGDRVRVKVGDSKCVDLPSVDEVVLAAAKDLAVMFRGEVVSPLEG